jgi:Kef-type K+ transport system membrane component KefB
MIRFQGEGLQVLAADNSPVAALGAHELLMFLLQCGLLLLSALLLGRLATRLGMAAVAGELCAGLIFGPSVLGHLTPGLTRWLFTANTEQFHLLDAVGQVGVLLLVGYTGMQLDLDFARRHRATAARVSLAGVTVPVSVGVLLGFLLPDSLLPAGIDRLTFALFLGVAMGVSAIPVLAKTLADLQMLHRNVAQLTLCAVMIDDVVGWLLLAVVSGLAVAGVSAGALTVTVGFVALAVPAVLMSGPILRLTFRLADRLGLSQFACVVIAILLGSAATQSMKLEAVFGAFLVGIALKRSSAVRPDALAPLRTGILPVLAPIFFATVGLRMDLTLLGRPSVLLVGLAVLFVAIAGKFIGAYIGARLSHLTHWEGIAVGAGMNARGVIEVVIASVGLRLHVLNQSMYTIVILVAIVTSIMASPLLRLSMKRVENEAEEDIRIKNELQFEPAPLNQAKK